MIYWVHCVLLGKQHHVKWFIYHNFSEKFFWYDNNKTLKMCIFCYPSTTTLGVIETVKNSKAYFQSSIQFLLIWNKHFEEKLDQINVFAVHWYLVMMETYHFSTINLNFISIKKLQWNEHWKFNMAEKILFSYWPQMRNKLR